MRAPANLKASVSGNQIELEWDKLPTNHFEYEITRLKSSPSIDYSTEIIKTRKSLQSVTKKLKYVDGEDLEAGAVYYYTVCYLCPGKLVAPLKSAKVRFMPLPPAPVDKVTVVPLSRKTLAISWEDYAGDQKTEVDQYEVYVEEHGFLNISGKKPVLFAKEKSCLYEIPKIVDRLFVAVVGTNLSKQKVLSVSPVVVKEPWRDALARSSSVNFSMTPLSQFQEQEIVIEISDGTPSSIYSVLLGTIVLPTKIHTDIDGFGRITTNVPEALGPGRHNITIDDGNGSTLTTENSFLVPVRLSPTINDVVEHSENPLTHGFDSSIIDRINFADQETVSFRFRKGKTLTDLKLDICQIMAQFRTGAVDSLTPRNNVYVRLLPSFAYPPFIFNSATGSLNLFGIVQSSVFETALDWANQINDSHEYEDGENQVVLSITEFDVTTQSFANALVNTGNSYEGDFPINVGNSYLIEVKEPVNNYAVSGDGISSFNYLPLFNAPVGGFHSVVLVADGGFSDASTWAAQINQQHLLVAAEPRVVTSISRWSATSQSYDVSLIDTGTSYEGNFNLVPGQGYVVELKEPVTNYVLTGTELTESACE